MTDTSTDAWNVESFAVEPEDGKVRFHDFGLPKALCTRSPISVFDTRAPYKARRCRRS